MMGLSWVGVSVVRRRRGRNERHEGERGRNTNRDVAGTSAGGSTGAVRDGESAGLRGTEVGTDGTERKTGRRRKRNYAGTKIRS